MKKTKIKQSKPRVTWGFSPITRVKKSKKTYSRDTLKQEYQKTLKLFLAKEENMHVQ